MDKIKLENIYNHFKKLENKLSDSAIISDQEEYKKLAKEYSSLKPVGELYEKLKGKEKEKEEAEQMLDKEESEEMSKMIKNELKVLDNDIKNLLERLEDKLIAKDVFTSRDIIVEIRAGTGGDEATLFVADLFRMYEKYASHKGFKVEIMDSNPTGVGGFKEIIFSVQGKNVYKQFKYESGVHRVQRVPETESSGRIHTSAVSVVVLPEAEDVDISINPQDLKIDVFRSSGPGGQSVNTADSAVRITHLPTGTVVSCQDERSQLKNKVKAMRVLKSRLLDRARREKEKKESAKRREHIGSGDRSEKIRTYNFPQGRVTDHRINFTLYKLDNILQGNLDILFDRLQEEEKKLRKKYL